MLLLLTYTGPSATDLGYLLGKHPHKVQSFALAFGKAHVFFPEATTERCTAALLLDVDPIGLVRRPDHGPMTLFDYVNDRPYVASSFLAVALAQVLRSAMSGLCKERPDLAAAALDLELSLSALPCRGGEPVLRKLFEPLGYAVNCVRHPMDAAFADWGPSAYFDVHLQVRARLCDVLNQLYILVPVLDDDKHYFVAEAEAEKLLAKGAGWLERHPHKDTIAQRYLGHKKGLVRAVLDELDDGPEPTDGAAGESADGREELVETRIGLNERRTQTVVDTVLGLAAREVIDIGCGEGRLLRELLATGKVERLVGIDASTRSLEIAARRLRLGTLPEGQRDRIQLWQGALGYVDKRLRGADVCTLIEVIEHIDADRLPAVERALFGDARPRAVVVTTPNVEYNVRFAGMAPGKLRHSDHRFEWTRAQFRAWAEAVATAWGYALRFAPVGGEDPECGPPTQMAVFERRVSTPVVAEAA